MPFITPVPTIRQNSYDEQLMNHLEPEILNLPSLSPPLSPWEQFLGKTPLKRKGTGYFDEEIEE